MGLCLWIFKGFYQEEKEGIIELSLEITVIATDLLKAIPVYFLWNLLIPQIFHLCHFSFYSPK